VPWKDSLTRIEDAARSRDNLMPHIVHAVESYATVGEISDTLRKVFGEYKEAVVI
jgi:methylmalonyl-CoA mutase, N-terminal domain